MRKFKAILICKKGRCPVGLVDHFRFSWYKKQLTSSEAYKESEPTTPKKTHPTHKERKGFGRAFVSGHTCTTHEISILLKTSTVRWIFAYSEPHTCGTKSLKPVNHHSCAGCPPAPNRYPRLYRFVFTRKTRLPEVVSYGKTGNKAHRDSWCEKQRQEKIRGCTKKGTTKLEAVALLTA